MSPAAASERRKEAASRMLFRNGSRPIAPPKLKIGGRNTKLADGRLEEYFATPPEFAEDPVSPFNPPPLYASWSLSVRNEATGDAQDLDLSGVESIHMQLCAAG